MLIIENHNEPKTIRGKPSHRIVAIPKANIVWAVFVDGVVSIKYSDMAGGVDECSVEMDSETFKATFANLKE